MSTSSTYKEVIRPPFWLIAFMYFMLFSLVIAIWAALGNAATVNSLAISIVLGIAVIYYSTSTIEVSDGELKIKKAHIPLRYLGASEIIDKKSFSVARTRGADPAAYLATTFWISEGIKVEVIDERDPTPYWLISTRRPAELIKALQS
jgi:hypothetical protein